MVRALDKVDAMLTLSSAV